MSHTWADVLEVLPKFADPINDWQTTQKTIDETIQVVKMLEAIGARPGKLLPNGGDAIDLTWDVNGIEKYYLTICEDGTVGVLVIDQGKATRP